jgi:hypothetical protein
VRSGGRVGKEQMTKRKLIDELLEGVSAMKSHREGKLKLRSHKLETPRAKRDENPPKKHGSIPL